MGARAGHRRTHRPQRRRVEHETRQTPLGDRRSIAWLFGYHRLSIRYDRYANLFCAFLTLAATITCFKKLRAQTT
jgi:hypothetical protein